jgi:hypothetical protein
MAALWENNVGTDVIIIYFKRWRKIMSLYLAAEHYNCWKIFRHNYRDLRLKTE